MQGLMAIVEGAMVERRRGGTGDGAKRADGQKELSVIVPTYNETENIRPLAERLFKATKEAGLTVEMLIVDDESAGSEDGGRDSRETVKIAKALTGEGLPVRIHCRKKSEGRGLSSAVLLGFKMAKYPVLLCMDADLQHEPESVPAVAQPVMEGTAEFAIGSRHVEGGGVGFEWSPLRRAVSFGATLLAWFLAPSTDPMSGFFCVSREWLPRATDAALPRLRAMLRWLGILFALCAAAEPSYDRPRRPRRLRRRAAAEMLGVSQDARYDTSMLEDEAQVALSTAAFLSIVREEVTPQMLLELLHLSLRSAPGVYGAAIAFEPDSFPWRTSYWRNMTEPFTLPKTKLWEGREAVLYAPYVARGPTDPHKLEPL
eukprot:s290_g9.t1